VATWQVAGVARAELFWDDDSPLAAAVRWQKRSGGSLDLTTAMVDAKVASQPASQPTVERRLEGRAYAEAEASFGGRFGLRGAALARDEKRRSVTAGEAGAGEAVTDADERTIVPTATGTFVTDKGVEIFAGGGVRHTPKYTEKLATAAGDSKRTFGATNLLQRYAGLVRRFQAGYGGAYYALGDEKDRKITQSAYDGTEVAGHDRVFYAPRFGLAFGAAAPLVSWDGELTFVQARGKGDKDQAGKTPYGDYFEGRVGAGLMALGASWRLSLMHRTLSYSSSGYVSLDTIPITAAALRVGSDPAAGLGAFAEVQGVRGKDRQSVPEFNASYQLWGLAVTAGLGLSF
jgi:hypothetical protein